MMMIDKSIISIHAPYTGGDWPAGAHEAPEVAISIHAPYTGGDGGGHTRKKYTEFQSTPPTQGATTWLSLLTRLVVFQSTPPTQGATWPWNPK